MPTRLIYCAAALLLALTACQNSPEEILPVPSSAELTFGRFYGMCVGPYCTQLYRLTDTALLESQNTQLADLQDFYTEPMVPLDSSAWAQADGLLEAVPVDSLFATTDTTLGCPDCYDQGGLYLAYDSGTQHRFWVIDQNQAAVPAYLHAWMDQANAVLDSLKN